jgi:hypothetical protein
MEERITQLENELRELKAEYYKNNFPQQQVFVKDVIFNGNSTFTSLNPTTSFSLGGTPAVRQSNIVSPSGGATQDGEARTAINSILSVLDVFGFTN